ncbi:WhiB family transcriptional regulator [Streptomyces sp. NPDC002920]
MSADRYAWMESALCAQTDPDTWVEAGPGYGSRQAKRICGSCPVRLACAAHARRLEAEDGAMAGVWGGASQRQRRSERRQHAA